MHHITAGSSAAKCLLNAVTRRKVNLHANTWQANDFATDVLL